MNSLKTFTTTLTSPATEGYLQSVLKDRKASFVANMASIVANNATLQDCDAHSLIFCGLKATALGLSIDPALGLAYPVPYRINGNKVAQFQLSYKGLIQLALRAGNVSRINVTDVREGELTRQDLLTGEVELTPAPNREQLKVIGYACYLRLSSGFEKAVYWTVEKVEEHGKKFSKTYGLASSVWKTNFDAMAKKTVLKDLLSRYCPVSAELTTAINSDCAVFTENENTPDFVDAVDAAEAESEEMATEILTITNEKIK